MKKKKETSPSECLDGFFFAQIMEKDYQNEAVSDMIERHERDYYERANQRLSPLLEY